MTDRLKVDADGLRTARKQFEEYLTTVEQIQKRVDGEIRALGTGWYGDARVAYDRTIDGWIGDYDRTVKKPLTELMVWFSNTITTLENVEHENAR